MIKPRNLEEIICVSSLPYGGSQTLAGKGLENHYQLTAAEIAARISTEDPEYTSPDYRHVYDLVQNTPTDLFAKHTYTIIEANRLSHVAISGCTNQLQISALQETFSAASFSSVWLESSRFNTYESILRHLRVIRPDFQNFNRTEEAKFATQINRFLEDVLANGMADIRDMADLILDYEEGKYCGTNAMRLRRFITDEVTA
ncbi:MAG: hypothetical protein WBP26_02860 [Candidatus Saccharimonadales bacterium]